MFWKNKSGAPGRLLENCFARLKVIEAESCGFPSSPCHIEADGRFMWMQVISEWQAGRKSEDSQQLPDFPSIRLISGAPVTLR